ncbi:MAG: Lrp/AsnC family transcriptional regulator [Chloroflexota bacterium]|jgi:Lrp/AsnC family leucine-responsive transcriptional regulator|nr:Lrp/AsnC family transcriptional regulator [Chloroflexia bacterium]MDQ3441988.1 Lrp/AsnC family transcriptional regulator [Chloroflexota bacterium]
MQVITKNDDRPSMSTIDTLDERILSELQTNGRLTMKALAERVGLSSPAMIERVRRLEERGVLAGYRAVVDPSAIGRPLTALISIDLDRRHHDVFLNRLRSEPSVESCHRITGEHSYLVKVHVSSTEELELLVDELGDAGAKCSTNIVLSSPIEGAPVVPPEGTVSQRTRLTRRRRRSATMRGDEIKADQSSRKRVRRPDPIEESHD